MSLIHDVEYGELSLIARTRDHYALIFRRGAAIDRMCLTDFDLKFKIVGRIEVIERAAIKDIPFPDNFKLLDGEEVRYYHYLKELNWKQMKI